MPALMPTPAKANTPVMGMEPPMTMSSAPCASTDSGCMSEAAPAAAAPSIRLRRWGEMRWWAMLVSFGCDVVAGKGVASVAEGPQVEEAADAPPHLGQAVRLEHQEADDQQAEDDGAHG